MRIEPTETQQAISSAVTTLLERHAGPSRARTVIARGGYDHELDDALGAAGFSDIARRTGALDAALVAELVARHAGVVAFGATALVAPGALRESPRGPIAIARAEDPGPVRFGAQARTLIVLDGAGARLRALRDGEAEPVASGFGFPMARVKRDGGDRLDDKMAERARAWWQVALAAETAGTMRAALDRTIAHVRGREQFGKPIGAFQAVQHRLAECTVLVEATRLLALEAAWLGAPSRAATSAATYAGLAAKRVFHEAHQLHGAMGLTREHDLHVWSMRLPALRLELLS